MARSRELDLDAARAARGEVEGPGPTIRFGGEEFQLPPELPWEVVDGALMGDKEPSGFGVGLRALFGDDYGRFTALHPMQTDIVALFSEVFALYNADDQGESSASES